MIDDPIVKEIRRIRQAYAQQFNNDLHAICEDLRRQELESDRQFRAPADRKTSDDSGEQAGGREPGR